MTIVSSNEGVPTSEEEKELAQITGNKVPASKTPTVSPSAPKIDSVPKSSVPVLQTVIATHPPVEKHVSQYKVYVLEGVRNSAKTIEHLQKDGAQWIGSNTAPLLDENGRKYGSQVVLLYMNTHAVTVVEP